MNDKPISPLRRRMTEDMTVRNFVEKTHNDYIRHVRTFTAFLGRAPDTAAPSRQLSIPATDTLNNSLNHQPELRLPASRVTNRLKGHDAPALTPSASAKSP
ncbi:MAG: integrase [Bradyrhizobium sp.]|jgi:hypothetical protein|nr:integrase [Bradyrhizobium sp.]